MHFILRWSTLQMFWTIFQVGKFCMNTCNLTGITKCCTFVKSILVRSDLEFSLAVWSAMPCFAIAWALRSEKSTPWDERRRLSQLVAARRVSQIEICDSSDNIGVRTKHRSNWVAIFSLDFLGEFSVSRWGSPKSSQKFLNHSNWKPHLWQLIIFDSRSISVYHFFIFFIFFHCGGVPCRQRRRGWQPDPQLQGVSQRICLSGLPSGSWDSHCWQAIGQNVSDWRLM